ncbi:MAG: RluA family pseudouridine synthase [Bacteroidota bacterium]|jgi:23S rRNA pseudouridine1911/1915/1917 synthase
MKILYEDNHLIAVEKRAGQTVQPEPGKPPSVEEEVKAYIKEKYEKPGAVFVGVIHRLDMPVSGIVLLAKTSKALERMNKLFEQRNVKKMYTTQVENGPSKPEDTITHWLKRDDVRKLVKAYESETPGTEKAQLHYVLLKNKQGRSILQVTLLTGRKHQIRAQLSAIGCPITGDVKYKASKAFADHRILLHASELSFVHPVTNEPITIRSTPDFLI